MQSLRKCSRHIAKCCKLNIYVHRFSFQNSGYPQGRIIRRSRIMKDSNRNLHLSWKDLNIGVDLKIFGIIFHLTDCDSFTKVCSPHQNTTITIYRKYSDKTLRIVVIQEFLRANGIELNEISMESKMLKQRQVTFKHSKYIKISNSLKLFVNRIKRNRPVTAPVNRTAWFQTSRMKPKMDLILRLVSVNLSA